MSNDRDTVAVYRPAARVLGKAVVVWAAVVIGQLGAWSLHALMQSEPTQTFTFNFIQSNVGFIAKLAVGGAILATLVLELGWDTHHDTEVER